MDQPGLKWELRAIPNDKGVKEAKWMVEDQRSWGFNYTTDEMLVSNMLVVNASDALKRSNSSQWQLHYYFQHINNIDSEGLIRQTAQGLWYRWEDAPDSSFEGAFNFTIKDDASPFIFSNEMCGQPLGAIGYVGRGNVVPWPVVLDFPTPARQCRTKLNDTGFAEIYGQFADGVAGCGFSNSSAPNSTAPCRATTAKGDAALIQPGSTLVSVIALMLGVYLAFNL